MGSHSLVMCFFLDPKLTFIRLYSFSDLRSQETSRRATDLTARGYQIQYSYASWPWFDNLKVSNWKPDLGRVWHNWGELLYR